MRRAKVTRQNTPTQKPELPETDTTLPDKRLESSGIHRAPQLNVDDPSALDDWPVFFQPLDDSPEFRKTVVVTEEESECYSICPHKDDHVDRLDCAIQLLQWFDATADAVYPEDQPEWLGTSYGPGHKFPGYFGSEVSIRERGYCPSNPPPPEWMTFIASGVTKGGYRHVSLWVADNTSHEKKPGEALRSEIVPAVCFIRKQMQLTKVTHCTTPVIVYSIHHNDTARITQVWWDGEKETINFRQSRILHIASKSFTAPDVLLLIRWKACTPLLEPKQAEKPDEIASKPAVPVPGASPAQSGAPQVGEKPKTGTGAAYTVKATTSPHRPSPHRPSTPERRTTTGTPVGNVTPPRHASTLGKAGAIAGDKHGSSPPQRPSTPGGSAPAVKSSTTVGTAHKVNVASSSAPAAPNRTTNLPNRGTNSGITGTHTQRPGGPGTLH